MSWRCSWALVVDEAPPPAPPPLEEEEDAMGGSFTQDEDTHVLSGRSFQESGRLGRFAGEQRRLSGCSGMSPESSSGSPKANPPTAPSNSSPVPSVWPASAATPPARPANPSSLLEKASFRPPTKPSEARRPVQKICLTNILTIISKAVEWKKWTTFLTQAELRGGA